jgi:hypothetical protein
MTENLSLLRQDFLKRLAYVYFIFFCFALTVLFAPSAVNWMLDSPVETMLPTPIEQLRLYSSILADPLNNNYFEHSLESGPLSFFSYFTEVCICYSWGGSFVFVSILSAVKGIVSLTLSTNP